MRLVSAPHDVREWTVMVYMASDTDLELFAQTDLEEMQKVGSVRGKLHVVVQLARRRFKTPIRFYIREGRRDPVSRPQGPKDTGNPDVLTSYLDWARRTCPARRYMLILWGHSFGLGFGRNYGNALTIRELGGVLRQFSATLPPPNRKLDVLGCDSCSMSKAEAVYQFRDSVDVLVASQTLMPFAGWPYQTVLGQLVNTPDISTADFGDTVVRLFIDSYKPPAVSLSAIKLNRSDTLEKAIAALSTSLLRATRDKSQKAAIHETFRRTANTGGFERPLIDLADLCKKLSRTRVDDAVKTAARATLGVLKSVVAENRSQPRGLRHLNGLGIYAPLVAEGTFRKDLEVGTHMYRDLDLMRKTEWDELVLPRGRRSTRP
jgi:hypothetical protein